MIAATMQDARGYHITFLIFGVTLIVCLTFLAALCMWLEYRKGRR